MLRRRRENRQSTEFRLFSVSGVKLKPRPIRYSSLFLEIGPYGHWLRLVETRGLRLFIHAQENRSIDGKLDVRAFGQEGVIDLHGRSEVAESGCGSRRCLCGPCPK